MHTEHQDGETETHVTTEEVRSGASTHVTRYVLAISLTLAIIALLIVMFGGFWKTNQTGADNVQTSAPANAS